MDGLIEAIASWQSLLLALFVFGFVPGFVLRIIVRVYPRDDPRRDKLVAQLYVLGRLERPLFVAEQIETALFDGIASRAKARTQKRVLKHTIRFLHIFRRQLDDTASIDTPVVTDHLFGTLRRLGQSQRGYLILCDGPMSETTSLARILVQRLLDDLGPWELRVPVWVDAAGWDPRTTTSRDFVVAELTRCWEVPRAVARRLFDDNRIIVVLDRFDQLPRTTRDIAMRALFRPEEQRPTLITASRARTNAGNPLYQYTLYTD